MARRITPLVLRFFPKVQKTTRCWLWTGSRYPNGYGYIYLGPEQGRSRGRYEAAHRVSWRLHKGEIPTGLRVLHKCDNRRCVRPGHLFLGTSQDNSVDMIQKGRGCAKLTPVEVALIRSTPRHTYGLAQRLGVSRDTIYKVRNGRTWKHVPLPVEA